MKVQLLPQTRELPAGLQIISYMGSHNLPQPQPWTIPLPLDSHIFFHCINWPTCALSVLNLELNYISMPTKNWTEPTHSFYSGTHQLTDGGKLLPIILAWIRLNIQSNNIPACNSSPTHSLGTFLSKLNKCSQSFSIFWKCQAIRSYSEDNYSKILLYVYNFSDK